jgi:hypothetical protein
MGVKNARWKVSTMGCGGLWLKSVLVGKVLNEREESLQIGSQWREEGYTEREVWLWEFRVRLVVSRWHLGDCRRSADLSFCRNVALTVRSVARASRGHPRYPHTCSFTQTPGPIPVSTVARGSTRSQT